MLALVVALAVASSEAPVRKLAAPGLEAVNLDPKVVNAFVLHFSQQLTQRGFSVVSQQEVAAVLGLERQKQLLGCADGAACNTEIASALGVDALITGSVGKTSAGYLINVKIVRSSDARTVETYSARPRTDEEVLDFLEASAKQFASSQGLGDPAGAPATLAGRAVSGRAVAAWVVGGVGVAGGAVGVTFLALAQGTAAQLGRGEATTYGGLQLLKGQGQQQELFGWIAAAAGGAALATSVVLFALGRSDPAPAVAVVPAPGGALLSFGGAW